MIKLNWWNESLVNFRIVENDYGDRESEFQEWVRLYNTGMLVKDINQKLKLSAYMYKKYRSRALQEGLIKDRRKEYQPRYYYKNNKGKYMVRRKNQEGKIIYYGTYKTEKEAKARVDELKKNNWGG